jgi:hypothetical protein
LALETPGPTHHNVVIMKSYHSNKLSALLLITMGRAESHDPPARS